MMNIHQPTASPGKHRSGGTEERRPPALRAEEPVVALDLVDVTERVVRSLSSRRRVIQRYRP